MIPIRVKKASVKVNNLDALEYKYLMEVPTSVRVKHREHLEEERYSEKNKALSLFTDNGFSNYTFLGKIGDSNLFINDDNNFYTADLEEDFMYMDRGYSDDNWCFVINDELFRQIVNKRLNVSYRGYSDIISVLKKYENKELNVGDLIQRFLAYGYKEENRKEKKAIITAVQKEEKIKGNKIEVDDFNKNGQWNTTTDRNYGEDKTIYNYGDEYVFNKDINKIFTLEDLNGGLNSYNSYGTEKLNWTETLCVNKKVSYTYISKNKYRTYKVKFKDDKMYVDNVQIPVSRASFFISRADGNTEKLRQFKELSAVKVEFLALKNISINTDSYNYKDIPIEIKIVDKLFEITLLEKVVKLDWKELEIFKYSTQSIQNRFSTSEIPSLLRLFDISKAEMFDFMKRTQILDKLGEEDENN